MWGCGGVSSGEFMPSNKRHFFFFLSLLGWALLYPTTTSTNKVKKWSGCLGRCYWSSLSHGLCVLFLLSLSLSLSSTSPLRHAFVFLFFASLSLSLLFLFLSFFICLCMFSLLFVVCMKNHPPASRLLQTGGNFPKQHHIFILFLLHVLTPIKSN